MSYVPTSLFTREHSVALEVSPEELRALPVEDRAQYTMRIAEVKAQKTQAFWDAVSSFATAAIPIITFFGLERYFGAKGRR